VAAGRGPGPFVGRAQIGGVSPPSNFETKNPFQERARERKHPLRTPERKIYKNKKYIRGRTEFMSRVEDN